MGMVLCSNCHNFRRCLSLHFLLVSCSVSDFYDLMDCSLPGSSVHGICWARLLEWVAISSSRVSSQPREQTHVSCIFYIADGFFVAEPPGKPCSSLESVNLLNNLLNSSTQIPPSSSHIACPRHNLLSFSQNLPLSFTQDHARSLGFFLGTLFLISYNS